MRQTEYGRQIYVACRDCLIQDDDADQAIEAEDAVDAATDVVALHLMLNPDHSVVVRTVATMEFTNDDE